MPPRPGPFLAEALELWQEARNTTDSGFARHFRGLVRLREGDLGPAEDDMTASLAEAEACGDRFEVSIRLDCLALVARARGDLLRARELFGQALAHHHALGSRAGIAFTLARLGEIAQEIGEVETARASYVEALSALRGTGDIRRSFAPLWGMANLAAAAGDWANALNLAGATTAIVEAADLVFSPPEEATMANISWIPRRRRR